MKRRDFLRLAAGAAAVPVLSCTAAAQTYPSRPVRILIGFPPGGGVDVVTRLMGQWLSERIGQPVVIENRPGAGTNIAAEAVARSAPDGYTLFAISPANAINASLYTKLNFNFIQDITPVAGLTRGVFLMVVHPAFPAQTVSDFIAYAKANPGKINMASNGIGTGVHLSGELFKMMTGVDMVHVAYRGVAPAMADLLGGQVQVMFSDISSMEYVRTAQLRALAVTTARRLEVMPDIPTVGDFVPGYEASSFIGIGAPKNTPGDIVEKLNRELSAGLQNPKMKARIADLGYTAGPASIADFGKLIADETEK